MILSADSTKTSTDAANKEALGTAIQAAAQAKAAHDAATKAEMEKKKLDAAATKEAHQGKVGELQLAATKQLDAVLKEWSKKNAIAGPGYGAIETAVLELAQ